MDAPLWDAAAHAPARQKSRSAFYPPGYWNNHGWGFGLEVVTGADDYSASVGRFGWDGGLGTSWRTDPKNEIVGVLMTQVAAFPGAAAVYRDFWSTVYGKASA